MKRPKQRCNSATGAAPVPSSRRFLGVLLLLLMTFGKSRAQNQDNNNLRAGLTVSPSTRVVVNARRRMRNNLNLENNTQLVFALVPKTTDNPYFLLAESGCKDQAYRMTNRLRDRNITVVCEYVGPTSNDESPAEKQIEWMTNLLLNDTIAGIAVSVQDEATLIPALENLIGNLPEHKPVVTFDSDMAAAPMLRWAYIGTNNTFFGTEIARALLQLHPTVGIYGILQSGTSPNMVERRDAFLKELNDRKPGWKQLPDSPADAMENLTIALDRINDFASQNPDAIVSLMGLPMRQTGEDPVTGDPIIPWQAMYNSHLDKGIQFLCGDAMSHQLDLLGAGYVQALVGQLPHEMGMMSIEILYNISTTGSIDGEDGDDNGSPVIHSTLAPANGSTTEDGVFMTTGLAEDSAVLTTIGGVDGDYDENDNFIGTNCLSHIFIPLELPENDAPDNLLGNLSYVGYCLFGVTFFTAFVLLHWTINYRKVRVVQVAQPKFLIMVIIGVTIMASVLIPLGIDDGGVANSLSNFESVFICMSTPWLASIGFTMTFSALYAKTRRINKIFHSDSAFARVKVSETEVLLPFTVLLLCNFAVLIAWTVKDPLTYNRIELLGSDGWSRVLSSYGACRSDHVEYYLIPLAALNMGCLLMANWQAFEARHIEAEFSETNYIAVCMASMLQAAITGVPVLFVVKDNPQAFYLVLVFMIFVIGMVILLVIFVPKIMFAKLFLAKTKMEQKDIISYLIQQSGRNRKNNSNRLSGSQVGGSVGFPSASMYQGYQQGQPRWASTAPYAFESQVLVGPSQFAPSQFDRASQFAPSQRQFEPASQFEPAPYTETEEVISEATANGSAGSVGTEESPSNRMGTGQSSTHRMSHITEGQEWEPQRDEGIDGVEREGEGIGGDVVARGMSHVSHITEGSTERENRSTRSGLTNKSGPGTPISGLSMSSVRGRSSNGSSHRPISFSMRNLLRPSSHRPGRSRPSNAHHPTTSLEAANSHHSPHGMNLDLDDGEDGMIVYRTMSIMPDGSVHTRHSHLVYDFMDDDTASFYAGTPNESFRTFANDSGHSQRSLHTMNSVHSVNTMNNSVASPLAGSIRMMGGNSRASLNGNNRMLSANSAHTARPPSKPNSTGRTPRRASSDGPQRVKHRLPVIVLNSITERKEDSESSDRSNEIVISPNGSSLGSGSLRSTSHHLRMNPDLNCIPETGSGDGSDNDKSGDDESEDSTSSFKSAELLESGHMAEAGDSFQSESSVELLPTINHVETMDDSSRKRMDESIKSFASESEGVAEEAPSIHRR